MREQRVGFAGSLFHPKIRGHHQDYIDIPRIGTCGNKTSEDKKALESSGSFRKLMQVPKYRVGVRLSR